MYILRFRLNNGMTNTFLTWYIFITYVIFTYSNTQFRTKKKQFKLRMKRVDCWYDYTEALKIAHVR